MMNENNFFLENVEIINIPPFNSDTNLCKTTESLLLDWGLIELIPDFADKKIDIDVLKNLTAEDINLLIPEEKFGTRILFRTKLFEWKNKNKNTADADTVSIASTVGSWISNIPSPSTSKYVRTAGEEIKLDLKQILENTFNGKNIYENYKKNGFLTNQDRQYIVKVIADFWINLERQIIETDYRAAAEQIKSIFETEDEQIYIGSKGQRGKLVEKYYNLSKKYQKGGVLKSRYNLKRRSSSVESAENKKIVLEEDLEADIENHVMWLKNNISPENIVIEKWNLTFNIRRKDFIGEDNSKEVFRKWPILKQKLAIPLIELDFERIFPGKNTLLFAKWEYFQLKIIEIYKKEIKDPQNIQLLSLLEKDITEDSKNYILSILLNAVLKPQISNHSEDKKKYKPSILDAQTSFAVHVMQESFIESTFNIKKDEYLTKNLTIQPTIIVIGNSVEEISAFYIYFNDILYKAENFLKALSVTFQFHQVLNLEYNHQCRQVWNFIEEYFYELPISAKKTPAISSLLSALK